MDIRSRLPVAACVLFALGSVQLFGQATFSAQSPQRAYLSDTAQASQNQTTLQGYQQEQAELSAKEATLVENGATSEQLKAWHRQNAAEFALQQQRAQAIAMGSASRPLVTNRQPNIPANASAALRDYLTAQVALANARARIHNQLVQQAVGPGRTLTVADLSKIGQQENQLFEQQNAAALILQVQRARALARTSTANQEEKNAYPNP